MNIGNYKVGSYYCAGCECITPIGTKCFCGKVRVQTKIRKVRDRDLEDEIAELQQNNKNI